VFEGCCFPSLCRIINWLIIIVMYCCNNYTVKNFIRLIRLEVKRNNLDSSCLGSHSISFSTFRTSLFYKYLLREYWFDVAIAYTETHPPRQVFQGVLKADQLVSLPGDPCAEIKPPPMPVNRKPQPFYAQVFDSPSAAQPARWLEPRRAEEINAPATDPSRQNIQPAPDQV
jgi:hypothetical protein